MTKQIQTFWLVEKSQIKDNSNFKNIFNIYQYLKLCALFSYMHII